MIMIKCVLLDDEFPMLSYLQALCRDLEEIEVIKSYNNPLKFLDDLDKLTFNTCVLDINMPGINGLELAKKLEGKAIIFSTAYKEYAAEAFDLDAVDYLRKPYQLERLEKAFGKAQAWLSTRNQLNPVYVELNTNLGKSRINTSDITYIVVAENDRRDKKIWFKDGQSLLAKNISFDDMLERFPEGQFCKINRKTVVALQAVNYYTTQWVSCEIDSGKNPIQFKLSEQYREHFMWLLLN
ncbi:LytR/AlgR family response regulator transcription factor [Sphingobacterium arenae]|uniref:Response regulator n=1 Tax=Sphingobacterium arenae TaxID=1280598 RepID=A0ABR7Y5E6_9SPHI|nr:response regulator [Sphingobacterium arenae]MBD1426478.1 response regulator [Sphingobacterium arenae]